MQNLKGSWKFSFPKMFDSYRDLFLNAIERDDFLYSASRQLKTLFLLQSCFPTRSSFFPNQLTEHLWLQVKLYFRANQILFKSSCFAMIGYANYKGQNISLSSWIIPSFLERLENLCFLGLINWLFFNGDVLVKIGEFIIASLLTWNYNSYL